MITVEFNLMKASDFNFQEKIKIETLEDLKKIFDQFGQDLIVNFDPLFGDIPEITVYDDYIE